MKNSEMIKEPPTYAPVQLSTEQQRGNEMSKMVSPSYNRIFQLQRMVGNQAVVQLFGGGSVNNQAVQREGKNNTGLPDELKSGLESMSGYDMSDVKVHYNSAEPAKLQAHAYAQGNDIHVAPGQEKHLPHEGWHVVQQRQGRVQPTTQLKSVAINDNVGLEKEADVMGSKAYNLGSMDSQGSKSLTTAVSLEPPVMQGKFEIGNDSQTPLKRTSTVQARAMQLINKNNNTSSAIPIKSFKELYHLTIRISLR